MKFLGRVPPHGQGRPVDFEPLFGVGVYDGAHGAQVSRPEDRGAYKKTGSLEVRVRRRCSCVLREVGLDACAVREFQPDLSGHVL